MGTLVKGICLGGVLFVPLTRVPIRIRFIYLG